ncbi:MAG: hypothetical protein GF400_01135 [Candidatus Eisenbacteria bacterium]|nr:hypothetical protein [Candidatus Eisenbacteria bacterium]
MISIRMRAAWIARVGVLLALLSIGSSGGCDWFADPMEANVLPSTSMTACPQDVTAGDDVLLEWRGSDIDGSVVEYRWSYDERSSGTTSDTTLTFEDVELGEHRFEVAAVDDDGDEDPTPAVCEFTATEGSGLVGRVVLAEFMTTLPCANCPNAEDALDMMIEEYGADSLCIVAYHDHQGPDPLWTEEILDRMHWYTDVPGDPLEFGAWPAVIFDGDTDRPVVGAQTVSGVATDYRLEIDYRKSFGSPLTLAVSGEIEAGSGNVSVSVRVRDTLGAGTYVLRTIVIEDDIEFLGHDFGFSARDILDDEPLTLAAVGDSAVVERSFTVDPGWAIENMDVIAFVQNDDTREVLQSARLGGAR